MLNAFAPPSLAESWDNVGLLIGDMHAKATGVLCALDLNEAVIEEAIKLGANCIVTHHPFIFKALKKIDFQTAEGRMIRKLIKHDLNIFAMHTNFDIATGGINDYLASRLGLVETKPLKITSSQSLVKVSIYTPQTHLEQVREAIVSWNPCTIGNYTGCTFAGEGVGTFIPGEGAEPHIGELNQLEKVEEFKLECMINPMQLSELMTILKQVHPYEEIAYDVYKLENMSVHEGLGRIGLCKEMKLTDLIKQLKELLGIPYVRLIGDGEKVVSRVALCSGSGASFIGDAIGHADVYITGDVGFHDGQAALSHDLSVIDVGHYASENIAMPVIAHVLEQKLQGLQVSCSKVNGEVFQIL